MADQSIINELTGAEALPYYVSTRLSWKARMEYRRAFRQLYPATTITYSYPNYEAILAQAINNVTSGVEV